MREYGWGDTVKFEKEIEITKGSESVQIQVDAKELYAKNNIWAAAQKERKNMKIEDMKVGAIVKCTKPEWDCCGDIFEIKKKLPGGQWELERLTSGRGVLIETHRSLQYKTIVTQQTLQHNFKLDKQQTVRREIKIVCFADNTTFIDDGTVSKRVGLYHEDKYDEFVGAVEALAKLYGRKSPFDEIEELKKAARAAAESVASDKWLM